MIAVETGRAFYVAGRVGSIRAACRAVGARGRALGTVASLLARATPNPWIEAAARDRR
jgi:hypothetical protein